MQLIMRRMWWRTGPICMISLRKKFVMRFVRLSSLIGAVDVENLLDEIFASFCLGKVRGVSRETNVRSTWW